MPMFHQVIRHLNRQFDDDHIGDFANRASSFAPGCTLNAAVLEFPNSGLIAAFQQHLNGLPPGMREMLRAVIHHALTSEPPVPLQFSWVPAYGYRMTIWEPECGLMIQFGSRAPGGEEPTAA